MDKVPIAVYSLLALAIMFPLLGPGYYLVLDMQWGPNTFADFHFNSFYGYSANFGAHMVVNLMLAALSQIMPVEIVEKLLLFSVILLSGSCLHYSLPPKLGNSRYFGGFLYALNPFFFIRFLAGNWILLLSYAFWPLAIKSFYDFLKRPEKEQLVKAALMTFLVSMSGHGLFIIMIGYLVLFLAYLPQCRKTISLIKKTICLAAVFLAMSLFWLVPSFLSSQGYSPASPQAYLADFGIEGVELSEAEASLTMHGFWRPGFIYTKDVFDLWYLFYFVIAALSITGLYALFKEDTPQAASLAIIFLFGFLLSLGQDSPLLWLFELDFLPLAFIFRDTQKFVGLLALVYSILGAWGVSFLSQRFDGKKILPLFFVLIPLIYNFGFFGFLDQVHPTQYPQAWAQADSIIASDDSDSRILTAPPHLYRPYWWVNNSQKTLGSPASQFFSKRVTGISNIETKHIYSDVRNPKDRYIRYMYDNRGSINNTAEMLLPLNVQYVMLFKHDELSPHYLYLFNYTDENLELVFDEGWFFLFRNNLWENKVLSTDDEIITFKDFLNASFSSDVIYEKIHPAYYRIIRCEREYFVFPANNGYLEFDGQPPHSRALSAVFEFTGPGALINKLFYYVLALFLFAWYICLAMLTEFDKRLLAVPFPVIYLVTINGLIGPHLIGWLIALSFVAVFADRLRRPKSF